MYLVIEMDKVYFCIDLKTFYASVECVERGLDPFNTDLIVADKERGKGSICLAISPKMKKRGIRNRCRVFEIPAYVHPIVAKPRMKKYIEYSALIYKIYLKYISKEDIHVYSIDEAFLDVTNYLKMYKMSPTSLAKTILKDIYDSTGITASAGIGTNLYLAKIALDIIAKHDKSNIAVLNEQRYRELLWHHIPLSDFWQIGIGTQRRLNKLHLKDMYDVVHADEKVLYKEFGVNARYLIDHAKGIEPVTIADIKRYKPKSNSISNSQVLFKDYSMDKARIVLIEMIESLVLQLVSKNLVTNSIGFIIGYSKDIASPLKVSKRFNIATSSYKKILDILLTEYDYQVRSDLMIRKIGIWFSVSEKCYEQLDLFSLESEDNDNIIEKTMLFIKNKFGKDSIMRGISYVDGATQIMRNKLIGGHNAE